MSLVQIQPEIPVDIFFCMKNGILLSGGTGSRLAPLTHVVNKHLLGVNGKFIIDYPIHTLRQMGVENLTVVLGGNHFSQVVDHLKDGRAHGFKTCNYVYQGEAKGIAQAVHLCRRYVDNDDLFTVILGDNIFEEPIQFAPLLGTQIVLKSVPDPKRFGVAFCDKDMKIADIKEKPLVLDSQYQPLAITGCYSFDYKYFDLFNYLQPSARGEYEITDMIKLYHHDEECQPYVYQGFWSDAGTHESIAYVNNYFYAKQNGNT
jgi:glucose-1-phosphate thymidylyltransferase